MAILERKPSLKLFTRCLDLLFPPRCLGCRSFLDRQEFSSRFCSSCASQWPVIPPGRCSRCCYPFFNESRRAAHLCGDCLQGKFLCPRIHAVGLYEGLLHDLILRMKYHGDEKAAVSLGQMMGENLGQKMDEEGRNGSDLLIIPVPLHPEKLRERGYNQSAILAREIAKILKIPVDPFGVKKRKPTPSQADLSGDERRKNLQGVFVIPSGQKIKDRSILVVDDVYTTGTTIEEMALALHRAGAKSVEAIVLARAC